MFKFKNLRDNGDATCTYDIEIGLDYTLKEFMASLILQKEFGTVYTQTFKEYLKNRGDSYEYRYAYMQKEAEFMEKYGDKIITAIEASGGWGRMDYYLTFETDKKVITNGELYNDFLSKTKIDTSQIEDWRPARPFYGVPYIPMAIVIFLKDKSKLIYISEKEQVDGK